LRHTLKLYRLNGFLCQIWLGEEIPETGNAIGQLPKVIATLKTLQTPPVEIDSILPPLFVTGIRHLLTCAWWPRLWVLQEATLARDAIFICGSYLVSWKLLSALVKQIKRLHLYSLFRRNDHRIEFCDGFSEIHNIELVRHTHSDTLAPNLLRICRQRICFDPCDRVYAVIGLMDKYVQEGFVWEPGEKVEDLYPPFVAILLRMDPTAMLLSLNETTQRNPHLPSWCPDLHYRSLNDVLADYEGYHAGFTIQTTTTFDFDQNDPGKIRTKGIIMDTVETISSEEWAADATDGHLPESPPFSTEQRNIMLLQSYIAIALKMVEKKDIWRIFIGNMIGQQNSKLHWLAGFSSIHDRLANRRWKEEAKKFQTCFHDLQVWSPGTGEPSPAIRFYLKNARRVCYGRKLFTTKAGHIGLGPRSMTVGDHVCILKCAKVPFVLKKHPTQSDTYYLRGEAYVQGLMYGEYLKVNKGFYWITLV